MANVGVNVNTNIQKAETDFKKFADTLEKAAEILGKAGEKFKDVKDAIDNNTSVLKRNTELYKAINEEYKDTGKELKNVADKTKDTTKEQTNLGKQGKITANSLMSGFSKVGTTITLTLGTMKKMVSTVKNLANKIQELVKPQAQYIEDLNFLEQAYKGADSSGKQLLDTLEKTVGYDPAKLVQTMATFRQLGNALDMDNEVADKLSNNLVKLSVDVKSITGQELTKVASKFQSAMAGNIRAVRAYGVDVTQAALQQELLRLGIDRKISSLNRAEKSILTYITMERQLSTANGDLARTVNSVGNQWEIFQNQLSELGRLIGGFFIPVLKAILPVLNGIIMALNTIISMVMSFFGIDAESFAKEFGATATSIDETSDAFDNMASSAGKAGKAAKEATKSLRGFDKLNNITTPTKSSSGGGGTSGAIGGAIDPKLLSSLKDYNSHLESMSNWATKIRDRLMEWLGFTKLVDKDGKLIGWRFEGIHKTVKNIYKVFENNPLAKIKRSILAIINPFQLFIAEMKKALIMNDDIWDSFTKLTGELTSNIAPIIETVIKDIGSAIEWLQNNIIKPVTDFIDGIFASVWRETILPLFERFNKEILPNLKKGFNDLWNNALKPVANIIGTWVKPALETVLGILEALWKNVLQPFVNYIINTGFTVASTVFDFIVNKWIPVITNVISILKELWHNVLEPIVNFVKTYIVTAIQTVTKNIKEQVDGIKNRFNGIIEFLKKIFKGDWEGVMKDIKDVFDKKFAPLKGILDNIKEGFDKVKKAAGKVKEVFSGVGDSAKTGLTVVKGLLGLKATGGIWNNGIWSPVKAYAGGGFPSRGEIFMARETKGPELVGRIGSSTAVLNNDQILDQMTIAVARGIAAAGGQEKQVNIIAEADTDGLLQFINFKNASKNRQYGL